MVGLKMKDIAGEFVDQPYMGHVSEYGILNCNHGVLPMSLLRAVGYFNESYRTYTTDPDLTASVLSSGKKVVMTRDVGVLHYREYGEDVNLAAASKREMGGIDNKAIYRKKFRYLKAARTLPFRLRRSILSDVATAVERARGANRTWLGLTQRDLRNLAKGCFIHPWDPVSNANMPFHLVQSIPGRLLASPGNPYRELVGRVD